MRKVTKVLLIGALVVAIAGILCIAGGFAAGASTQLRKSGTMASWMKFLPGSMFGEKDTSSANRSTEDGTFTTDSYLSKSQAVDLNIDVKVADIEIQTASDVSKDSEHGTVLVQIQYDTEEFANGFLSVFRKAESPCEKNTSIVKCICSLIGNSGEFPIKKSTSCKRCTLAREEIVASQACSARTRKMCYR